ncbi:MAG: DALR domain-containing protein, partial [Patescibacteria group bacterium]
MQIIVSEYMAKIEDDFNMPEAIAEFHSFIKFVNTGIADKTFSLEEE